MPKRRPSSPREIRGASIPVSLATSADVIVSLDIADPRRVIFVSLDVADPRLVMPYSGIVLRLRNGAVECDRSTTHAGTR